MSPPVNPRDRLQQMVNALPPVDLTKVTFTVTAFRHVPNDLAPTDYQLTVEATINSSGQSFVFSDTVPLSVGDGKTQQEIVQWLWEQPETQLQARQLQKQYVDTQAAIQARSGQPVPLPAGDMTGKPFVPQQS